MLISPHLHEKDRQVCMKARSAYHLNGIFLRFFLTNGTVLFLTDETERIELYHLSGMPGWGLGSTRNELAVLLEASDD